MTHNMPGGLLPLLGETSGESGSDGHLHPEATGSQGGRKPSPSPHPTPTRRRMPRSLPTPHRQAQGRGVHPGVSPARPWFHGHVPLRLIPSGWRGSASPARPSQTAACHPPAAAARPGRWSPWRREAPRWPSGSPAWLSELPAAPARERNLMRPRTQQGLPLAHHTLQKVDVPRAWTSPVLLCLGSLGTGRAPAGLCRCWMGEWRVFTARDPTYQINTQALGQS